MNSKGLKTLERTDRETGFTEHTKFLNGDTEPSFSDEFSTLEFTELEAAVTEKDGACAGDLTHFGKRMELLYAMAQYRDAQYAHAGRKFMLAVGANDVFQGLYEGGRIFANTQKR